MERSFSGIPEGRSIFNSRFFRRMHRKLTVPNSPTWDAVQSLCEGMQVGGVQEDRFLRYRRETILRCR